MYHTACLRGDVMQVVERVNNYHIDEGQGDCSRHGEALFSHLAGWGRALATTYDLPLFFLQARETGEDESAGILPVMLFAPPHSPRRLISLPYTDAAGILADSRDTRKLLLEKSLNLAEEVGAVHVELRQYDRLLPEVCTALQEPWSHTEHSFKIGLKRPLPDTEANLWDDLPAKVRNQVRKARRYGCVGRIGGSELLGDFYGVFSENMRDLGSPVHAFELFENALDRMPYARCVVIYCRDVPAAGAMVFKHGGTLFNPWASSLRRFRPDCPNMLLYWTMLSFGIEWGCSRFDFGRSSPGATTCRYKMQWGARPAPLYWHVFSKKSHTWQPDNESLVDEGWKKMDLAAARLQGPAIRRWISL